MTELIKQKITIVDEGRSTETYQTTEEIKALFLQGDYDWAGGMGMGGACMINVSCWSPAKDGIKLISINNKFYTL